MTSRLGRVYPLKLFDQEHKDKYPRKTHLELLGHLTQAPETLASSFYLPATYPAYDQGTIGSCTANALCMAYLLQKPTTTEYQQSFMPSRLFLYYIERFAEHNIGNEGAFLDDGYRALQNTGVCTDPLWSYCMANENSKPIPEAYTNAQYQKIASWGSVNSGDLISGIKQVLNTGTALALGISVYESFESDQVANTGIIPIPNTQTEQCLGGHAICLVGYNDATQQFLLINSWGIEWGASYPGTTQRGYCWMPYAYVTNPNLCDEILFMNNLQITDPPPNPVNPSPSPQPTPIPHVNPIPPPKPNPLNPGKRPMPQPKPRPRRAERNAKLTHNLHASRKNPAKH